MSTKPLTGGTRSSESGFSLAEIAIALFVLALGLLAIVSLFPAAVEFSSDTMMRTETTNIVRTAEAYLNYKGILADLDGGSMAGDWINDPSYGQVYYYPNAAYTTNEGCEGTYTWHATIFNGGTSNYLGTRPDHLMFIQVRIYRNWTVRPEPVAMFEIFSVPSR